MRIRFSRKEAGWDANNLLPNSSPLARLDCDSCCVLRKLNTDMLKGFLQESKDRSLCASSWGAACPFSCLLGQYFLVHTDIYAVVFPLLIFLWTRAQSRAGPWGTGLPPVGGCLPCSVQWSCHGTSSSSRAGAIEFTVRHFHLFSHNCFSSKPERLPQTFGPARSTVWWPEPTAHLCVGLRPGQLQHQWFQR